MKTKEAVIVISLFSTAILLQVIGCAVYNNWWPALTTMIYVLVPMPYLFFGSRSSSSGSPSGWADAGKFMTGFSLVGVFAIPCILKHAGAINQGALTYEILAAVILCISALLFDHYSSSEEEY